MTDAPRTVVYEFSGFRLTPAERLLEQNGRAVSLTPKAFDLLVYLVEHRGRLVEKNTVMAALWPETAVEEANLAFQISTLRRVLADRRESDPVVGGAPNPSGGDQARLAGVRPGVRSPASSCAPR